MKLINPKYRKTHITDKKIHEIQQKMEWEGTGTTEGPIVINNLNGLRPNIWINHNLYMSLFFLFLNTYLTYSQFFLI